MSDICFCGKSKRPDRLTCPRCFELYRKETKKQKTTLLEWVESKALKRLDILGASNKDPKTTMERELAAKKKELQVLSDGMSEKVSQVLEERLVGAGHLNQDELAAMKKDIHDELWEEAGGHRLYAQAKTLETEVKEQIRPIREVLQAIKKLRQDSVEQVVNSLKLG